MKFTKKLVAVLMALAMVAGLAACGSKEVNNTEAVETTTKAETTKEDAAKDDTTVAEDGELDRSEEIELIMYFTGNEPNDMAVVEDAVNEILLEKFNAKVDFQLD